MRKEVQEGWSELMCKKRRNFEGRWENLNCGNY